MAGFPQSIFLNEWTLNLVVNNASVSREVREGNPLGNPNQRTIRLSITTEGYSPKGNAIRVNFKRAYFKTRRKKINGRLKGKVKHFKNMEPNLSLE